MKLRTASLVLVGLLFVGQQADAQDDKKEIKKKILKEVEKVLDGFLDLADKLQKGLKELGKKEGKDNKNERNASASLKTITVAQADFKSNDRELNRVNDFWTRDVAGLYAIDNTSVAARGASPIKLIYLPVALADYSPAKKGTLTNGNYGSHISTYGKRAPFRGYWFKALKTDNSPASGPREYVQDTDNTGDMVHNTSRFGFCAFPAEYGKSGRYTFIINEGNTMFRRDMGGKIVEDWPTNRELAEKWEKMD